MDKLKHLKQQYVKVVKKGLTGDYDDEIFPNRQDTWYRHYSVKQEKSSFFLHEIEYKSSYSLKLRRRRGRALMCSWTTEHPPGFCYGGKNWKHHSKRKHQYYREKN
ncbi:hypothetical protein M2R48_10315 [Acinetobacter sp. I-MWF]|jgi:hypothetical protein|uniref:hypothetical protein n=1 Tax=Acinetobacter TaxID=469 RepID=UPI000701D5FE|nr:MULTISPECIES: hypothetical protein [Acinetobacter]KQX03461.1 hypothetical protein ASC84_01790 [Acinetobacter sp. Root1280]MCT9978722.1 hypothetical protein [Acinetobacter sp. I-MWF]